MCPQGIEEMIASCCSAACTLQPIGGGRAVEMSVYSPRIATLGRYIAASVAHALSWKAVDYNPICSFATVEQWHKTPVAAD